MTKPPVALDWSAWADGEERWSGILEGDKTGTDLTLIFYTTDEIGAGPKLHVHDYDEMFIVRRGRAMFTIGDRKIEAGPGAVLMGPAGIPHKFKNLGPGTLETTDIHLSPVFRQTLVDDPEID